MFDVNAYTKEIKEIKGIFKKNKFITPIDISNVFGDASDELIDDIEDYLLQEGYELRRDNEEWVFDEEELSSDEKIDESILNQPITDEHVYLSDPIKMYLNDIGKIPLLSLEDEIKFALILKEGMEAEQKLLLYKESLLEEERKELEKISATGIEARKCLIEGNLRLVVSIAKHYLGRGIPMLDLIQEGNLGLMKAVYRFDPTKGFRFSTYATWWIRQSISRAIAEQSRMVRLPVHMVDLLNQVTKAKKALTQSLKRDPTALDISKYLDIPIDKIEYVMQIGQESLSLDAAINDEDDSTLGEFLADDKIISPEAYTTNKNYQEELNRMLQTLTPREEKIIRMRYGLDNNEIYTLEEIGKIFGITRERVRQIEIKAIRRLRHPSRLRYIKDR